MYLILLETAGNQSYIFGTTNKLREHVGASQLTVESGTDYVVRAVKQANSEQVPPETLDLEECKRLAGDIDKDGPLTSGAHKAQIVFLASGKAFVLAHDMGTAKDIVSSVTERVARNACGMDMIGVIREVDETEANEVKNEEENYMDMVMRALQQEYENVRGLHPSAAQRHPMLPIVSPCVFSGRPAHKNVRVGTDDRLASHESHAKRLDSVQHRARQRMTKAAYPDAQSHHDERNRMLHFLGDLESQLEADTAWFAVIHADGNGLGQIFQKFGEQLQASDPRTPMTLRKYALGYRHFSDAIERCTSAAFRQAITVFGETPKIVPLILGGDDLTVVCDGEYGLAFAREYLTAFAAETQKDSVISSIVQAANVGGASGLTACAGIAFVKPHFPFHAAYVLAEDLCKSAKEVKTRACAPACALDFHVVFDSTPINLDHIRTRASFGPSDQGQRRLYGGPYVVYAAEAAKKNSGDRWWRMHDYVRLKDAIIVLGKKDDDGRRLLPNTKTHELRASLFRGKPVSDDVVRQFLPIYGDKGLRKLLSGDSLFANDGKHEIALLIDAMDAASISEHV